jgi:hypothetical protein
MVHHSDEQTPLLQGNEESGNHEDREVGRKKHGYKSTFDKMVLIVA